MRIAERIKPPKPGEVRFKHRFAWLPTYAGNACIWLESYEIMQVWAVTNYNVVIKDELTTIVHGEWKSVSTRLYKQKRKA